MRVVLSDMRPDLLGDHPPEVVSSIDAWEERMKAAVFADDAKAVEAVFDEVPSALERIVRWAFLRYAVPRGCVELVRRFVDVVAQWITWTTMAAAIASCSVEMTALLIDSLEKTRLAATRGWSSDWRTWVLVSRSQSMLSLAVATGDLAMIDLLARHVPVHEGENPLFVAVALPGDAALVAARRLFELGASLGHRVGSYGPASVLMFALVGGPWVMLHEAREPNWPLVELLIERGEHALTEPDSSGVTPLHALARFNNTSLMQRLLSSAKVRESINVRSFAHDTPLHWAARYNHVGMCRLLVSHGADIVATNASGKSPLAELKTGVQCDALVPAINSPVQHGGMRALHRAASKGDLPAIDALVSRGAAVDAGDDHGTAPLTYAVLAEHVDAVSLLVRLGADINRVDSFGESALLAYLRTRSITSLTTVSVVRVLFQLGAKCSNDLLEYALRTKQQVLADACRQFGAAERPRVPIGVADGVNEPPLLELLRMPYVCGWLLEWLPLAGLCALQATCRCAHAAVTAHLSVPGNRLLLVADAYVSTARVSMIRRQVQMCQLGSLLRESRGRFLFAEFNAMRATLTIKENPDDLRPVAPSHTRLALSCSCQRAHVPGMRLVGRNLCPEFGLLRLHTSAPATCAICGCARIAYAIDDRTYCVMCLNRHSLRCIEAMTLVCKPVRLFNAALFEALSRVAADEAQPASLRAKARAFTLQAGAHWHSFAIAMGPADEQVTLVFMALARKEGRLRWK